MSTEYRAESMEKAERGMDMRVRSGYQGYKDLRVFQLSYSLAMELFEESKHFPPEERYGLTDQLRRAARSIPANIAEAWRKRKYEKAFVSKLVDCSAEASEAEVWLEMCRDCSYLPTEKHAYYASKYDELNRMLSTMIQNSKKFTR